MEWQQNKWGFVFISAGGNQKQLGFQLRLLYLLTAIKEAQVL